MSVTIFNLPKVDTKCFDKSPMYHEKRPEEGVNWFSLWFFLSVKDNNSTCTNALKTRWKFWAVWTYALNAEGKVHYVRFLLANLKPTLMMKLDGWPWLAWQKGPESWVTKRLILNPQDLSLTLGLVRNRIQWVWMKFKPHMQNVMTIVTSGRVNIQGLGKLFN